MRIAIACASAAAPKAQRQPRLDETRPAMRKDALVPIVNDDV